MALIYPKATEVNIQDRDGGTMVGGPPRGIIHTTETNPKWGFFTAKWFYSVQFLYTATRGVEILQTFDLARASRALFNGPLPVQTNRCGSANPNIVIVGYAKDTPLLPDPLIEAMAEFMVWCGEELDIPTSFPLIFQGGESYGTSGVGRLSVQEWLDFSGWGGHQDVPDGNTHWDPGRLPVDKFRQAIAAIKGADEIMATYQGVKNVPTDNAGNVLAWAKGVIDRNIERGIIVTSDNAPDDWAVDGRLWIFLDRLARPIEEELDDKDLKLKALAAEVSRLKSAPGGVTSGTEFTARVL